LLVINAQSETTLLIPKHQVAKQQDNATGYAAMQKNHPIPHLCRPLTQREEKKREEKKRKEEKHR
jgi:hypothetical protein